jgi:hypothetical protein
MRCRFCGDAAGFWRRRCRECRRLWSTWLENRFSGMAEILTVLARTGVAEDKIQRFLNAEPRKGRGTVRDLIAADMTNQVLAALGQAPCQHGGGVKRLRERGGWKDLDRRPPG